MRNSKTSRKTCPPRSSPRNFDAESQRITEPRKSVSRKLAFNIKPEAGIKFRPHLFLVYRRIAGTVCLQAEGLSVSSRGQSAASKASKPPPTVNCHPCFPRTANCPKVPACSLILPVHHCPIPIRHLPLQHPQQYRPLPRRRVGHDQRPLVIPNRSQPPPSPPPPPTPAQLFQDSGDPRFARISPINFSAPASNCV